MGRRACAAIAQPLVLARETGSARGSYTRGRSAQAAPNDISTAASAILVVGDMAGTSGAGAVTR